MTTNQRGGIISNLILIPAGIALMLGFFLLGYYVGRYEGKKTASGETVPPLPEVVSKNIPKPEEFTFYKTLTGKEEKTVSIELKPKAPAAETKSEPKTAAEPAQESQQKAKEKLKDKPSPVEKKAEAAAKTAKAQPAPEKKPAPAKQAAPASSSKMRYTVQVSSHQEKGTADEDVRKLKQSGFAAYIVASALPGKGTWYRVRVGSFTKRDAAEKLQKEVRSKAGVSPIVVLE